MIGRKQTPWKRIGAFLAAAAVTAGLLVSPLLAGSVFAMDLTGAMKLTLHAGPTGILTTDPALSDTAVADIYRVAYAEKDPKFETVHYTAIAPYDAIDGFQDALSAEKDWSPAVWESLAAKAAEVVLADGEDAPKPLDGCSGVKMETQTTLPAMEEDPATAAGLYLVVVRGDGITDKSVYVSGTNTVLATGAYKYTYTPLLVAVPTTNPDLKPDEEKEPGEEGYSPTVMTSDGEWINEVAVTLKPLQEPNRGKFKIVKKVPNFDQNSNEKKATFIFEVIASDYPSYVTEKPYKAQVPIEFTKAGSKTWPDDYLDEEDWPTLPVGVTVTVREKYTGSVYKLIMSDAGPKVIAADGFDPVTQEVIDNSIVFTFVDDYTPDHKWGGSIVNKYSVMVNDDGTMSVEVEQQAIDYRPAPPDDAEPTQQ